METSQQEKILQTKVHQWAGGDHLLQKTMKSLLGSQEWELLILQELTQGLCRQTEWGSICGTYNIDTICPCLTHVIYPEVYPIPDMIGIALQQRDASRGCKNPNTAHWVHWGRRGSEPLP
ncbi:hypothetical protein Sjap_004409 [Stephania japonica]|uniref:Uncharacterized protein n=1 Tax=Stephania japonica TaxID=461633 RepID=A0AAP0PKW3_9MAGN